MAKSDSAGGGQKIHRRVAVKGIQFATNSPQRLPGRFGEWRNSAVFSGAYVVAKYSVFSAIRKTNID
jgi:hypothetical protein